MKCKAKAHELFDAAAHPSVFRKDQLISFALMVLAASRPELGIDLAASAAFRIGYKQGMEDAVNKVHGY